MSQQYAPSQLTAGMRATFFQQAAMENNYVGMIASVIASDKASESHGWMGESAFMTEIVDEVVISPVTDTSYTLTNVPYAAAMAVSKFDLRDDQSGGLNLRVRQLAQEAMRHPNKLLMDALVNGTSTTLGLGYDGGAFFASHAARGLSGTFNNIVTGTGTTTAQVQADIGTGIARMLSGLGENGQPVHQGSLNEVTICAPVAVRQPVLEATEAAIISNTSNVGFGGIKFNHIFDARLDADSANDYYLLATGSVLRPLIFQDRDPLEFTEFTDGETAFKKNQWLYKAQARYAVGYGRHQWAVKINNA